MTGAAQTKALASVKSLYAATLALSSYPDLINLNTTYYNALIGSGVFATAPTIIKEITKVDLTINILHYVNLDNYVPDLQKLSDFWVSFGTYVSASDPILMSKLATTYTQPQVDAMAAAFMIPATATETTEYAFIANNASILLI